MNRLTRLALNNPAMTYLLLGVLLILGMGAALNLKRELIPDVQFPLATIVAVWPGASADEVTRSVVRPIEDAVEDLDDVEVVAVSSTASDSFGAITVRAEYGTSSDALNDAIETALKKVTLPNGVEDPEIVAFDLGDLPVLQASASASANMDAESLQRLISEEVVPELESIEGVSQVSLAGDREDRLVIRVDPDRMREQGVTVEQIQGALSANNLAIPAGSLNADGKAVPLLVGHRVRTADDVRNLVLPGGGGSGSARAGRGGPPLGGTAERGAPEAGAPPAGAPGSGTPTADAAADSDDSDAAGSNGAPPAPTTTLAPGRETGGALTRLVVVAQGDTLASLARRFGSEPEAIRAVNRLTDDTLEPGTLLRIPVAEGLALPSPWRLLGAERPEEITPAILRRALDTLPELVTDLTEAQLLALPDETVSALPLPFIMRQPEGVRERLMNRLTSPRGTPEARLVAGPRLAAPVAQGQVLTVGDVADVQVEPERASTISRSQGRPSIGIVVAKDRAANTVTVVRDVEDKLEELANEVTALSGVEFSVAFEQATFIERSLSAVQREAFLGALLAVLVILLFLRSWRATIVIAVSIPGSLLIAFLLMQLQGLTLNLLTLSAITVAIGRVVDDSIVVLENIFRHIQRGEERLQAVLNGTKEVATAITASTLVAVAVFLPLGFVGGITAQFFNSFAFTITWALLASLFVAVTIIPVMARHLMSKDTLPEERESALQRLYTPSLEWALDHRALTLILAFAFFGLSLLLLPFIPQTFLPSFGEKQVQVELELPPGSQLATTDDVARRVEALLMDDDALDQVEATVGRGSQAFSFGGGASGGDGSRAFLLATFEEESGDDPEDVADRIRKRLADLTSGEAVTATVSLAALGGPAGSVFDLQIRSDDEALLREANDRILVALKDEKRWDDLGYDEIPIENLESNLSAARPVLGVDVDPRQALERGLTAAQVAFAVRQLVEGLELGDVELERDGETETLTALVVYPDDVVTSVDGLRDYEVMGPAGPVRLGDVATITARPGPVTITRVDGERAALLDGEIKVDDTFGVIAAANQIIEDLDLSDDVEVGAGVESAQQQEGFRDMLVALPISILIVYFIMVVAFGSLVHPFTILFSLPFALSGAFMALAVTQRPLGLSSLIGFMMLIGIVVTNAIVLVDLVQQYRERGMDARTALIRGGRTRLRPILMTALAAIIALLPLSLGIGGGESLIAEELATVVIGGLLVSTLLTLLVVPVIYSFLDGLSRREHPISELPPEGSEGVAVPASPEDGPVPQPGEEPAVGMA